MPPEGGGRLRVPVKSRLTSQTTSIKRVWRAKPAED